MNTLKKIMDHYKKGTLFDVLIEKTMRLLLLKVLRSFYLFNLVSYHLYFGLYKTSFSNPITLSQKLFVIRNSYLRSSFANMVSDKFDVRNYISKTIGEKYLNNLISVHQSLESIDLKKLPHKFVIKASHGSNSTIIVDDKYKFDLQEYQLEISKWLKTDYSLIIGETQYYRIKPKIVIEELLENSDGSTLLDYKFWCFNSKIEFLYIRKPNQKDYELFSFDTEFNPTDHIISSNNKIFTRPKSFESMIRVASQLAKDFRFVRVDLYDVNGKCIFGELTLTPTAGLNRYINPKYQEYLGSLIDLKEPLLLNESSKQKNSWRNN